MPGQSGPGSMAIKGCPYSPTPQHYWDLTISLFNVISRTFVVVVGGLYPSAEVQSVYSTAPANWANNTKETSFKKSKKISDTYWQLFVLVRKSLSWHPMGNYRFCLLLREPQLEHYPLTSNVPKFSARLQKKKINKWKLLFIKHDTYIF